MRICMYDQSNTILIVLKTKAFQMYLISYRNFIDVIQKLSTFVKIAIF